MSVTVTVVGTYSTTTFAEQIRVKIHGQLHVARPELLQHARIWLGRSVDRA